MKKQFLLFVAATLISISSLMAQEKGRMRQTPEERTKTTMARMEAFDLKPDVRLKAETIFNDFFKAQQSYMQEARSAGTVDRASTTAKRQELITERDAKLKQIFTAEQYAKWISEIEPSLRPQRPSNTAPAAPAN